MIKDILQAAELRDHKVSLVLTDIDSDALALMTQLAERIKDHVGCDVAVEQTVNRQLALEGADYVISAVERSRMSLWEQDFRVPLSYGFKHCLGENGGPGALFHALRSLNIVIPICRDMERICPDALFLNFTNPEARVLHGICHLTKAKAVGLCHGIFGAMLAISKYLGKPIDEFHIVSAGMNHFYCLQSVVEKSTGEELLGKLVNMVIEDKSSDIPPLFRKMAEIFGIFTYPSDDHIGEYVSFGAEFTGVKWHYGQESRPITQTLDDGAHIKDYASGEMPLDETFLQSSGELAVPIICDIELNRGCYRSAVNVVNNGYIPNLPAHAVVEVPATVDETGIHPHKVEPIPEPVAAIMRTHYAIHALITEAFRTGSKKLLLQALLLDPVVNNMSAAENMLDDMLELQKDYLPAFS